MITGGSSGIGLAIAQRFLCEGAERIIIVGTNKMRLLRALEQLRSLDASLWSGKEDGMPNESIDKATAENRSNAPNQEDPLQQQQQPLQIDGSGQALSQQLSSPARNSDVGFDNLAYSPKRCEKSVGTALSEADCELIDLGRFTIAVGDVGDPSFWGDKIKKTMVRLTHS